jgi:hypothetical protein
MDIALGMIEQSSARLLDALRIMPWIRSSLITRA